MRLSMLRKIVSPRRLALVSILLVAASGFGGGAVAAVHRPYRILGRRRSDLAVRRIQGAASLQGDIPGQQWRKAAPAELALRERQLPLRSQQRRGQPGWDHRRNMERNQSRNQRKHRGQGVRRPHLGRHRRAGLLGQPVALDARQQAVFLDIVRRRHPERHHQHEQKLIGIVARRSQVFHRGTLRGEAGCKCQ
jgi:hypothetical protein